MTKDFQWECPKCGDFYFDIEDREYFPWGDQLSVRLHMRCTSCNHKFIVTEFFLRQWATTEVNDDE